MMATTPKQSSWPSEEGISTTALLVTVLDRLPPDRFLAAFLAGIKLGIPRSGNTSTVLACPSLAVLDTLLIAVLVPRARSNCLYVFICRAAAIGSVADTFVPPE